MGFKKNFITLSFILILMFISLSVVYGGSNATGYDVDVVNESVPVSSDIVYALEDGHFNTTFSDGSNGYCLEYGEEEAKTGDGFYRVNTDYYDSSIYLKTYFLRYYTHTQKDVVVTQHMIWHFTDGFEGWRLNYTIINDVKNNPLNVGDEGYYILNTTHSLHYSFRVLLSPYEYRQDYFNYIISVVENSVDVEGNVSGDVPLVNNTVFNETSQSIILDVYEDKLLLDFKEEDDVNKTIINLNDKVCGNKVKILTIILMILTVISLSMKDYRRKI